MKDYDIVQDLIQRARLVRSDLEKYETEYYPEKVRTLVQTYIWTVQKIIEHGNNFLDDEEQNRGQEKLKVQVLDIIKSYQAFLDEQKARESRRK
tara:strand:+ start:156 stop:437 length:282 start_codon:yes stop_codon:yes gene_type:complete